MMISGSCVGESCVDVQNDVVKAKALKIRRSPDSGALKLSETLINNEDATGDQETKEKRERRLSYSSPGECVRFISPEVYRSNRQKYLRSYTFHRTDAEEDEGEQEDANVVVKKPRKWFKNLRGSMKMKRITKRNTKKKKNRDSSKSCFKFFFCCFCEY